MVYLFRRDLVLRHFRFLVNSVLLFTVPAIDLYPEGNQSEVPARVKKVNQENQQAERSHIPSYDEIMYLLEDLESGELEKRCSSEDLDKLNHYIAFLAQKGVLPDDSEESLSLESDIEELLDGEGSFYGYAFYQGSPEEFMIAPAIFYGHGNPVLCKSWVAKQWKHTKKFCKKHKKAIIIGSAVTVAAALIIVAVVAAPAIASGAAAAAGTAGAAGAVSASGSDKPDDKEEDSSSSFQGDTPPQTAVAEEAPILKSAIDHQISSFKENIVDQKFFSSIEFSDRPQGLSWEENGRTLGSLFAHDSLNNIQDQISENPNLAREIQEMELKYSSFIRGWNSKGIMGHAEVDKKFSTDYTYLYTGSGQEVDFNTLSYQIRGEKALACGYLTQAVHDLGKAIELNPGSPIPYLERGVAHFGLGQYDHSLEDYREFTSQSQKVYPLVVTEFSLGFAKGLPKGIYDSGEGIFLLVSDLVRHPIHTGEQMFNAFTLLADLALTEQWGAISEVLAPEVEQLVKEWHTIPSHKRGELAGYAFGKHGSDILIPGALTKVVSRGVKGAKELSRVYKSLQTAEKTLLLESVAGLESGVKVAEVVRTSQTTIALGEELGYSAQEMTQLKQAGKLEGAVDNTFGNIANNPAMRESFDVFERAQNFLKPYKEFMLEIQCREIIQQTGIRTFPKPSGIPENFIVRVTDKGAGMEFVHPTNTHLRIRVMPGKPHSPFPHQQKPYVIQMKDGMALDKFGSKVDKRAPEAHIPIDEFTYRSN